MYIIDDVHTRLSLKQTSCSKEGPELFQFVLLCLVARVGTLLGTKNGWLSVSAGIRKLRQSDVRPQRQHFSGKAT